MKELIETGQVGDVYYLSSARTNLGPIPALSTWDGDVRLHGVVLEEPSRMQDIAFLRAVEAGTMEIDGGEFVVGVVRVLEAIAESLRQRGAPIRVNV